MKITLVGWAHYIEGHFGGLGRLLNEFELALQTTSLRMERRAHAPR